MLWAFVSDIHGNRRGLERAEALGVARAVDRYVCLGDVIGRGDPEGCVEWVADHTTIAITGNRDLDHLALVRPDLQRVVADWPREYVGPQFALTHGDPGSHRLLRSSVEAKGFRGVADYLEGIGVRLWLYGHTHHARVWSLADPTAPLVESIVHLQPGGQYVVNVGTVGLPFARKGGPSMLLYEDAEDWLETVTLSK